MTVRRATAADAGELARLRALMYGEWGIVTTAEWQAQCAEFFGEFVAHDDFAAFVVDDPDVPGRLVASGVGWVVQHLPSPGNPRGRRGHVASMSTDPAARRAGHARVIIGALLDWFGEIGIDQVDLHATPMGAPLYESVGFRHGGAKPMTWRRDGPPVTWPSERGERHAVPEASRPGP